MKKHRNQTVSTQTRKAKPDKNNPKNWQKNPHHTPQQGAMHKTLMPQNKWHQTIHQYTIEFSKNTHPPTPPHRAN
ncbi:hypothetical protein, partial [Gordonia polyisoprenivorans]